jgi:hypothetical protein
MIRLARVGSLLALLLLLGLPSSVSALIVVTPPNVRCKDDVRLTAPVAGQDTCFDAVAQAWFSWDGVGWQSQMALATKIINVMDSRWAGGAVIVGSDSGTDSTVAIQAAASALQAGDTLFIPITNNFRYFRVTSAITLPCVDGLSILGGSKRTSRIRQTTAGADLFVSACVLPASTNGWTFRDFWADGAAGVAPRHGFNLKGNHRSLFIDMRISGFSGGACIFGNDSIIVNIISLELDGCQDSIREGSIVSFPLNDWHISHSELVNSTRYGVNVTTCYNWTITDSTVEAASLGGVRCTTNGNIKISGTHFEGNNAGAVCPCFDIKLGETSFLYAAVIEDNYFNGRGDATDYWPIRLTNFIGGYVGHNFMNLGTRFLNFEAGAGISDSTFDQQGYGSSVTVAAGLYGGVPASPGFDYSSRNRLWDWQSQIGNAPFVAKAGLQVGNPTGGDLGNGIINAAVGYRLNNGPINVASGGTGVGNIPANNVPYGNGTAAFQASSNFTFNGTTLTLTGTGVGITNPVFIQNLQAAAADGGSELLFAGDTGGNTQNTIRSAWVAASNLNSYLAFRTRVGGAITEAARFVTGMQLGAPTGGDPGVGKLNIATADGYLVNNVALKNITETLANKTLVSPLLTANATLGPTALSINSGGLGFDTVTAVASAPGAAGGKIEWRCGTGVGSLKIVAYGGTSATGVTVLDNIGSGVTGC